MRCGREMEEGKASDPSAKKSAPHHLSIVGIDSLPFSAAGRAGLVPPAWDSLGQVSEYRCGPFQKALVVIRGSRAPPYLESFALGAPAMAAQFLQLGLNAAIPDRRLQHNRPHTNAARNGLRSFICEILRLTPRGLRQAPCDMLRPRAKRPALSCAGSSWCKRPDPRSCNSDAEKLDQGVVGLGAMQTSDLAQCAAIERVACLPGEFRSRRKQRDGVPNFSTGYGLEIRLDVDAAHPGNRPERIALGRTSG